MKPQRWVQSPGLGRSMSQVRPGDYAPEVAVVTSPQVALAHGRLFVATSGKVTVGATNSHIRGLLTNPADSGVKIVITELVANIDPDVMVQGRVFINPTGGLPATTYTPFNLAAAAGATYQSKATFAVDAGLAALSGGTATDLLVTAHTGRTEIPIGLPLAPGVSLGITIPLGLLASGDGAFAVHYQELDL